MDNIGAIKASLAGRYASALFSLAKEADAISAVEKDLDNLQTLLGELEDLKNLTHSQKVNRNDAVKTMQALARKLKLHALTGNTLSVLAENRRLDQLSALIHAYGQLSSAHRGEVHAEVISAFALSDKQLADIKQHLDKRMGQNVIVTPKTDNSILGGLIVKIGSQMIDSSIKTRLGALAHAMKG